MNETHLPPLPPPDIIGPDTCAIVRLYMAVWNDLTQKEQQLIKQHLRLCEGCTAEEYLLRVATHRVAKLALSEPSQRVDLAIRACITAQGQGLPMQMPLAARARRKRHLSPPGSIGMVAAAALILLTVLTSLHLVRVPSSQQALIIPASMSWTGYVLYQVQSGTSKKGQNYQVVTYYDLANKHMNAETVMNDTLDVIMVSDGAQDLGLDMLHHVAQWDAQAWGVDESIFDLKSMRTDLSTEPSDYMGTAQFAGQQVYRVRCGNDLTMLLNTRYMPVNVLDNKGTPIYSTLKWLQPNQVPTAMWDMSVPADFQMGSLPAKP